MALLGSELDSFIKDARSHLRSMGSMLDQSDVWIRACDHRDVVAAAHISRIGEACESLLTLCEARRSHDAAALARLLLEHSVSLTYLFSQADPVQACQAFVFDSLTHIGKSHQNAAKHYPEQVRLDAARSEQAMRLGEYADYQGKFKRQLSDIQKRYPMAHFDWYDELVYGDLSIRTHPHAAGLDAFAPDIRAVFKMRRPLSLEETASAAVLGWGFTLSSFAWVSFIWGLPIVEDIYLTGRQLIEAHPKISPGILAQSDLPELAGPIQEQRHKRKGFGKPKRA